jgi:hypothetical protein
MSTALRLSERPSSELSTPRKRASQACAQCRHRKVACSLTRTGIPCEQCVRVNSDCTTTISRRSRQYRFQNSQRHEVGAAQTWLLPRPAPLPSASSDSATPVVNTTPHAPPSLTSPISLSEESSAKSTLPLPSTGLQGSSDTNHDANEELPAYIRPASRELESGDTDFLMSCGALSIPHDTVRDQLLLAFALYVYPQLPVVDFQDICDSIEGRSSCKISLLLFQAIMFSGTAFVDLQALIDAGFENRLAARAYFFRKIKVSDYVNQFEAI